MAVVLLACLGQPDIENHSEDSVHFVLYNTYIAVLICADTDVNSVLKIDQQQLALLGRRRHSQLVCIFTDSSLLYTDFSPMLTASLKGPVRIQASGSYRPPQPEPLGSPLASKSQLLSKRP